MSFIKLYGFFRRFKRSGRSTSTIVKKMLDNRHLEQGNLTVTPRDINQLPIPPPSLGVFYFLLKLYQIRILIYKLTKRFILII